jgi:hypothetical protein
MLEPGALILMFITYKKTILVDVLIVVVEAPLNNKYPGDERRTNKRRLSKRI